jgi:hypothetical protein
MKSGLKVLGTSLVATTLLATSAAQAMEIIQFDKMADQDQHDYVNALIVGAQKVLLHETRDNLATQVQNLFTIIPPGDSISLGLEEFETNLAQARIFDAEAYAKDHTAQRVEVEDAMAITLKKNKIDLPDSFFTVASGFKPKNPPKQ